RSRRSSKDKIHYPYFAMCIDNRGYEGSLWIGKVYEVIKPHENDGPKDIRVVDEEGEDYLYSNDQFVAVALPANAKKVLSASAPDELRKKYQGARVMGR